MRYIVKKQIPIAGGLKKGYVIDSSHAIYSNLDFSDKEFFEPYPEQLYEINQEVVYDGIRYKVINIINNGINYVIRNDNGIQTTINNKTKILIPTNFWFINSNGQIQSDYEERKGINKDGLKFKKLTGNYFVTFELAQYFRDKLLKDNENHITV